MIKAHIWFSSALACAVSLAMLAQPARAQEAMYTNAATMPSPGVLVVRPQFLFSRYGYNPNDNTQRTDRYVSDTSIQVGLVRALSLTIDIPVEWESRRSASTGQDDSDYGLSNPDLMLKYRFYQDDSGGIDTVRAAILAGAKITSGDDRDFNHGGEVNPHIGAVLTIVRGQHGFNQEVTYQFNTGGDDRENLEGGEGEADVLRYNTAYLFRFIPERYTSTTTGAWYATIELNGIYETNGDNEIRWSPGLMFEHRDFALEIMAQLPLTHNVTHRAELDWSVGIGIRMTF